MVTKNPKIGLRHKCKTEIPTGSNQAFFSISEQTASSLSFSSDLVRGVRASASERERRAAKPREARNEGLSHARGHLRISHVSLDGPRKKRDCS